MRRLVLVLVPMVVLVTACGSGPMAPPVTGRTVVCIETACITHPDGWEVVETGPDFVRFRHPGAPETALASLAPTDMRGVVEQAGGSWPARPEDVVRGLWDLLAETGSGELAAIAPAGDGAVRSFGAYDGGWLWFLLVPRDSSRAIGVEVRGPNRSWEAHADVFFSEVVPVP